MCICQRIKLVQDRICPGQSQYEEDSHPKEAVHRDCLSGPQLGHEHGACPGKVSQHVI